MGRFKFYGVVIVGVLLLLLCGVVGLFTGSVIVSSRRGCSFSWVCGDWIRVCRSFFL